MNEAAFRGRIKELNEMVRASPLIRPKEASSGQEIYHSQDSTTDPSVEDRLDLLRLQVKYLLFDLEATRRENRYLRRMLESRNRNRRDSEEGGGSDPKWQTPPGQW